MKNLKQKYLLGIILLYGLVLRVLHLGKMPMWIDETISASAMKAITLHGYPLLESGSTYYRSWLFSYLSVPFIWIFGIDIGSRVISVIFGVLTIYLAYLFGNKFISKKHGGLIFAFLVCISTLSIIYSKQARFYQMFQFFYFLSFYLFYKFIILKENLFSKRYLDHLFLILAVLISINTQFMGYIILPLFALIYIINNLKKIWQNKILLTLTCIFFAYMSFFLINRLSITSIKDLIFMYADLYLNYLFRRIIIVILFVSGFIYSLIKNWKFTLSFGSFFIIPVIGLFFVDTFGTRYVYFALFGLFFFIAYLIEKLKFKLFILALFIILNLNLFNFTGVGMVNYDSSMPWADWKPAYDFVSNSSLPIVSTWTPAAYLYGSADYWIRYSIGGRSNETWMLSSDFKNEKYLNATLIESVDDFPEKFILILDHQASRKLSLQFREYIIKNCDEVYSKINIWVFECEFLENIINE